MPNKTTNYGLNKPTMNENVDINVLNENMDILDEALSAKANKPTVVTATLAAGKTIIDIADPSINTDSIIDIYTSVYGVNPTSIAVSAGSIALTFDAQTSAVKIRIEVR